jgi:exodeoxyribonuclease VII small subunit
MNYEQAYQDLKTIVSQMENEEISVDKLSDNIKKASELIKICKEKLSETEKVVTLLIEDMKEQK